MMFSHLQMKLGVYLKLDYSFLSPVMRELVVKLELLIISDLFDFILSDLDCRVVW